MTKATSNNQFLGPILWAFPIVELWRQIWAIRAQKDLGKHPACSHAQQMRANYLLLRVLVFHRFPAQQRNCWIAALELMTKLKINTYRTAGGTVLLWCREGCVAHLPDNKLRSELNAILTCNQISLQLWTSATMKSWRLSSMSEEEFLIIKFGWMQYCRYPENPRNSLPKDTACQIRATMKSTIIKLDKGGIANKLSDTRPILLFQSGYQLLNYSITSKSWNGLWNRRRNASMRIIARWT